MGNITIRLRPVVPSLRVKLAIAPSTPTLDAAVAAAEAAAATSTENAADTAADVVLTHADVVLTHADAAATAADVISTNADAVATAADAVSTGQDAIATAADRVQTGIDAANSSNAANSAAASAADAAMSADSFDDVWLGTKTSDPTLDNDGNALVKGQLYFNAISDTLKIYNGASWQAYTAASGISAVVDDASPALGGDLDANGHTIAGRNVATDGTKLDGISSGADVTGTVIHAATGKTTPVDADEVGLIDSAASNVLKKVTWANIKATLKTYFDTLYQPLASALTSWASVTRASGFDTFAATPSSANLASLVTDETGTGALVLASAPTLTNPVVGTQSALDNSTKAASTAYADRVGRFATYVNFDAAVSSTKTVADSDSSAVVIAFGGTTTTLQLPDGLTRGLIFTITNENSGNMAINYTGSGGFLLWLKSGGTSTGNRTLAAGGIATVTSGGGASSQYRISGIGLS